MIKKLLSIYNKAMNYPTSVKHPYARIEKDISSLFIYLVLIFNCVSMFMLYKMAYFKVIKTVSAIGFLISVVFLIALVVFDFVNKEKK